MTTPSPEEWEIIRRSVAMLSPRQPCQPSREIAVELLDELGRCRDRERNLRRLVEQMGEALEETGRMSGGRPGDEQAVE